MPLSWAQHFLLVIPGSPRVLPVASSCARDAPDSGPDVAQRLVESLGAGRDGRGWPCSRR